MGLNEKCYDKIITSGDLTQKILNKALDEAKNFGDEYASIEMVLYAMLDSTETIGNLLKDNKITKANLKYLRSNEPVIKPILANTKAKMGNWKAKAQPNVRLVKVST